ncbi:hypothetical protein J3R82DRAFT_1495 [Butyriboletus roseoflavus]|nr:hypothetical protein J3R82DRAFT_1495 [Butyriboletus roseoflavus]
MTCSSTKSRASGKTPADIVTYRYNGELMYVPVAPNYIQALSYARSSFPQLKRLRGASLSLSLPASAHEQLVGISALAWPKLITHMTRYQVIDVHVTQGHECMRERESAVPIPDITITYADADDAERMEPAPPYSGPDVVEDEKASYTQSRPPSPSLSTLHPGKRSWLLQKFHGQ